MHRDCKHDWHRHFHQPWVSGGRFAERFRHRRALDGGWNLRDVRRAFLCRISGGVAALRRRIPFSPRDLSSVARISRRLDLGYGRLLGASRDRRDAIRHLPSRNFPINKSAVRRYRIRLIGHIRPVVRPPTRKRFPDRVHILKVALIAVLIAAGFFAARTQTISFLPIKGDTAVIASAPFAISLYWVMYAYSGWNASTYITGEIRNPRRNVPLSLIFGTIIVIMLYVCVNAVFLRTTPAAEMIGKQQVALIASTHIFGPTGGKIMAAFICLGLISTVSAMMWIGPRVTAIMGEDLGVLKRLSRRSAHGIPANAILTQFVIVNVMLLTATFQAVVNYVQFSLALCSALTVSGVFVLRWRRPELERPYRAWGYPITPLIFLAISGWMLWHLLAEASTRLPSLLGLGTAALGLIIYFISPKTPTSAV